MIKVELSLPQITGVTTVPLSATAVIQFPVTRWNKCFDPAAVTVEATQHFRLARIQRSTPSAPPHTDAAQPLGTGAANPVLQNTNYYVDL